MPGDYRTLATIHDYIHMGEFARHMTPRLIDFAQHNDWLGRQIVDLGCGSGQSLKWLAEHGYIVTGLDRSPEMLDLARQTTSGHNVRLVEQNIVTPEGVNDGDMVLALDVMHEFSNLRELEVALKSIVTIVKSEKWFVFDIYTIEGLIERSRTGDRLEHDADGLAIFIQNDYDYERQIQRRDYTIFRQQGDLWARRSAYRVLRAYPVQGLIGLIQRWGFEVPHVLNLELKPHTPNDSTARVIIIAQKR